MSLDEPLADLTAIPDSFAPRLDVDHLRLRVVGLRGAESAMLWVLTALFALMIPLGPGLCGLSALLTGAVAASATWSSFQAAELVITPREVRYDRYVGPFKLRSDRLSLFDVEEVSVKDGGGRRTLHITASDGRSLAFVADGHSATDVLWLESLLIDVAVKNLVAESPNAAPQALMDLVNQTRAS